MGVPVQDLSLGPEGEEGVGKALKKGADAARCFLAEACQLQVDGHAGDELLGGEGLHEVVVRACGEALHGGLLAGPGGDEEHGDGSGVGVLAHRAQEPEAVEARHHDVRHHEVGALGVEGLEGGQAVGGRLHRPPFPQELAHVVAHVRVVVHHEDAGRGVEAGHRDGRLPGGRLAEVPPEGLLAVGRRTCGGRGVGAGCADAFGRQVAHAAGEGDGKGAAAALSAANGHATAVEAHELLHEREADARALVGARGGALDAVEALEEARELRLGDAFSRVLHLKHHGGFLGAEAHRDLAVERELERVGEEVQHDFLPHVAVHVHGLREGVARHLVPEARALHRAPEGACEVRREGGEVRGLVACLGPARLEAGKVEEGVHELEQAEAVAVHHLHALPLDRG